MTGQLWILTALFAAVFAGLLWGRIRYDLVAFSALLVGVAAGAVPSDQAFSGFGHPATIVVALVLVVSAGLVRSGAAAMIASAVVDSGRALGAHIAVMGGVGAALSAFMNNVAALALLMPVDIQAAKSAKRPPGLTLMPLSFATILGGLVTLIGTPPNIIVAAYRGEAGLGGSFAMFDFAWVGLPCAIAGLAFVALIGWRLIPEPRAEAADEAAHLADYVAELSVPEGHKRIGAPLREFDAAADAADVAIVGLVRRGERLYGSARRVRLRAGDSLVVEAQPEALEAFRTTEKLDFPARAETGDADRQGDDEGDGEGDPKAAKPTLAGDGQAMIEVVVGDQSPIVGKTALQFGLLRDHGALLLGLSRGGRRIGGAVRRTRIRAGDILLLLTPDDRQTATLSAVGGLALAARGLDVARTDLAWRAIGLFLVAVAAAAVGAVSLPIALGFVVVAYVLTGIVPIERLYTHIEWPVVVLLGSMIPLGAALDAAGGAALIADGVVWITDGMPAWAVLLVLMAATMTLSDVLNNAATAIVAAPVAVEIADRLGAESPDAFLMGVAVAASCAFLTPIGHKNNTLILGPGGYAFGDYWRMGLPLELIVLAVATPAIMIAWPI